MKTTRGNPLSLNRKSRIEQGFYKLIATSRFIPSTHRYNLTLSHAHRFIWYRVAKVGTRTILNHLKACEVYLDVDQASWLHYPVNRFKGYFKFAFIRNPWDRLVSCWRDKVVKQNYFGFTEAELEQMQDFRHFVQFAARLDIDKCDRHLRTQATLIDLSNIDFIGRLENFEEDANYVFQKIGLPNKEIARKNVTAVETDYRENFDDSLAEQVTDIYRKDINLFGYRF